MHHFWIKFSKIFQTPPLHFRPAIPNFWIRHWPCTLTAGDNKTPPLTVTVATAASNLVLNVNQTGQPSSNIKSSRMRTAISHGQPRVSSATQPQLIRYYFTANPDLLQRLDHVNAVLNENDILSILPPRPYVQSISVGQ